jgi:hypothetical protein
MQTKVKAAFEQDRAELGRPLAHYGDALISDSKDQRLLLDYRARTDQWIVVSL